MIDFVLVASVLGQQVAPNGAVLELTGQTPRLIYGQLDASDSLTLTRNASEDKLVCSGEFEAADLRIAGTLTTVADLIGEVAALRQDMAQEMAAVRQFIGMIPPSAPPLVPPFSPPTPPGTPPVMPPPPMAPPPQLQVTYTDCFLAEGHNLEYLDRHNVQCGSTEVLAGLRFTRDGCSQGSVGSGQPSHRYEYKCVTITPAPSNVTTLYTDCYSADGRNLEFLDGHNVQCGATEVLTGLRFTPEGCTRGSGQPSHRYEYSCLDMNMTL